MTTTKDTGGPAFPHLNPNYDGNWDKEPQRGGMTLRDWFAGQALGGIIAGARGIEMDDIDFARAAFAAADAMLEVREE